MVLNILMTIKYFSILITIHFATMNSIVIVCYLSTIELLSLTNFEKWNDQIRIVLGCMDLAYALREPALKKLTS